jgi:hypothetical protein
VLEHAPRSDYCSSADTRFDQQNRAYLRCFVIDGARTNSVCPAFTLTIQLRDEPHRVTIRLS